MVGKGEQRNTCKQVIKQSENETLSTTVTLIEHMDLLS